MVAAASIGASIASSIAPITSGASLVGSAVGTVLTGPGTVGTSGNWAKWAMGLEALKGLMQVGAGFGQKQAGAAQYGMNMAEAELMRREGLLALKERQEAAERLAKDAATFAENQGHAYAGSGVTTEGTPIVVQTKTLNRAQEEVNALIKQGRALSQMADARSSLVEFAGVNAKNQGRNALYGSLANAGLGLADRYLKTKTFSPLSSTPGLADIYNGMTR